MAWQGRTAFISAGVAGIGFGIAQAFADAGLQLALSYRNSDDRDAAARWFHRRLGRPRFGRRWLVRHRSGEQRFDPLGDRLPPRGIGAAIR